MAVIVIPIAVSVHTVVSWVFAMTVQPMWHSTIFGPYFVVGAIFSGIAAIIIAMAIIRRAYHLEDYLKPIHFNNLGILLLVMALLWFYFTFAEFLTTYYGGEPTHMIVFLSKTEGSSRRSSGRWSSRASSSRSRSWRNRRTRGTVSGTVAVASVAVEIGMWLERFLIVVPSLSNPRLPHARRLVRPVVDRVVALRRVREHVHPAVRGVHEALPDRVDLGDPRGSRALAARGERARRELSARLGGVMR